MFVWLKKIVMKSVIKDALKLLPKMKEYVFILWGEHHEEILDKVEKAIKSAIVDFIGTKIG